MPGGTKPLHEPVMTKHQRGLVAPEGNFTGNAQDICSWREYEND